MSTSRLFKSIALLADLIFSQWMVNTNLTPLDPEECKNASKSKMTKALQNAYEIASENHDLQYFKDILVQWQEENEAFAKAEAAAQAEAERVAAEKALAASEEKTKKKGSRKSKGAGEDEDMDDVEAPKSSKKRKKDVESDADAPKVRDGLIHYNKYNFSDTRYRLKRHRRLPRSTLRRHLMVKTQPRRRSRRRRSSLRQRLEMRTNRQSK